DDDLALLHGVDLGRRRRRRPTREAAELGAASGAPHVRLDAGGERRSAGPARGLAVADDARPRLLRRRAEGARDQLVDAIDDVGQDATDVLEDAAHIGRPPLPVCPVLAAPGARALSPDVAREVADVLLEVRGEGARVARHTACEVARGATEAVGIDAEVVLAFRTAHGEPSPCDAPVDAPRRRTQPTQRK